MCEFSRDHAEGFYGDIRKIKRSIIGWFLLPNFSVSFFEN